MNNSEGQTQEPVKVFIADFKNKVLREKYSLDKEEFELMLRRKHGNFWNDYYRENEEKYISSLQQYPATWLTPEMDGKEFIEGKDFVLRLKQTHEAKTDGVSFYGVEQYSKVAIQIAKDNESKSSTEEEKDLWKTALNFFQGEYILKPDTTKEEVISELLSTYKISKR